MGTSVPLGRRRVPRALIALALALLMIEALAIGLELTRAQATVLRDPVDPVTDRSSGVAAEIRPQVPRPLLETEPVRFLLVRIERAMPITARPGGGRTMGVMPAGSRFYDQPIVAWVHRVTSDGHFGRVDVPYATRGAAGWISLRGLARSWTRVHVEADLSEHRITAWRGDDVVFRAAAATGAPASPTPAGHFFVTDRVPFAAGGSLGTFAFGISGIQPNLPAGWSGGDQLAIHGTNAPSTIGRSASAGCLRVSERVLDRLRHLLRLGTPVIVHG